MGNLSKDQEQLLAAFAQLSDEQQGIVLEAVQMYAIRDPQSMNAAQAQDQQHNSNIATS